jgi:hypothetical protein
MRKNKMGLDVSDKWRTQICQKIAITFTSFVFHTSILMLSIFLLTSDDTEYFVSSLYPGNKFSHKDLDQFFCLF